MKTIAILTLFLTPLLTAAVNDEADLLIEGELETSYASPLGGAVDLQYAPARYSGYRWSPKMNTTEVTQGVRLGLEWLPLGNQYGKPGIGVTAGLSNLKNVFIDAAEVNTPVKSHLYVVPLSTYLSYRADFLENQVLVPFAKIGLGTSLVTQDTELPSGINSSHYTFYSWEYSVGLEFCMNVLDPKSAKTLDSSVGINGTYLIFEYLNSNSLTDSNVKDLAHSEYRIGLRFEI